MGVAKYLKGQYDPLTHPGGQVNQVQVDCEIKDSREKVIYYPLLLDVGVANYLKGQYDPLTHPGRHVDQVDCKIKDMG